MGVLGMQGMVQKRRCRDVLFLLIFIAYWVGMFVVCAIAFQAGGSTHAAEVTGWCPVCILVHVRQGVHTTSNHFQFSSRLQRACRTSSMHL